MYAGPGVESGATLEFRYKAHNVHGWSSHSEATTIVAATVPSVPQAVESVHTPLSSQVTFQWTAPENPGGNSVSVDAYKVSVK